MALIHDPGIAHAPSLRPRRPLTDDGHVSVYLDQAGYSGHDFASAGKKAVTPDPKMMRYPVKPDGTTGDGELFTHGAGIGDGMMTDSSGNVWSTDAMPGTVRVTAPTGKVLGLLHMPTLGDKEPRKTTCASSLAFGGDDAKTLYVTVGEFICAVPLRAPGALEGPAS